jgi:hypothetical protein
MRAAADVFLEFFPGEAILDKGEKHLVEQAVVPRCGIKHLFLGWAGGRRAPSRNRLAVCRHGLSPDFVSAMAEKGIIERCQDGRRVSVQWFPDCVLCSSCQGAFFIKDDGGEG